MNNKAEKSLEHALTLLKEEWVNSFFFSQERAGEAQELGYAVSKSQCLLAELEMSVTPKSIGSLRGITIDEHFHILFLPTFTSGTLTVGFEVTDHNRIGNVFTKVPRYISKFARDDERGIFLSIAEHPTLGITDVTFGTMFSPGQRDHVLAQFHFKAFRKVMTKLYHEFDMHALRRSLTYCYCSVEMKPCASCGSTSGFGCECKLPMRMKIHPLDLTSEIYNIGAYEGIFRGVADLRVYSEGRAIFELNFNSCSEAHFTVDSQLQEELLGWAVQQTLGNCRPSIGMCASPPTVLSGSSLFHIDRIRFMKEDMGILPQTTYEPNQKLQQLEIDPSLVDLVMRGPFSSAYRSKLETPSLEGFQFNKLGLQDSANSMQSYHRKGRIEALSGDCCMSKDLDCLSAGEDSDQSCSCVHASNNRDGIFKSPMLFNDREQSTTRDIETRRVSQAPSSSGNSLEDMMAQFHNEAVEFSETASDSLFVPRAKPFESKFATVSASASVRYERDGLHCERPLYPASSAMQGMSLGQRNRYVDETARKRELRKARNRESARRSSIRKNLKFQKLQEDLANMKRVEAKLRSREQCMRKENLSMRAALQRQDHEEEGGT